MTRPAPTVIAGIRQRLLRAAPFSQMVEGNLDHLIANATLAYYEPDQVLFDPRDGVPAHLYIITQGVVVVERPDPSGALTPTAELNELEMFPIGALLSERPVISTFRARGDVFCLQLPRADFDALVDRSVVFKDFCQRRISNLLDLSRKQLQAAYVAEVASQQSMETALSDLQLREPVTCSPDMSIRTVVERMGALQVGSMVVVDDERHPVGIFTRYDLVRVVTDRECSLEAPISSVMVNPVLGLPNTDTVGDAALLMTAHGIRHVVVRDDREQLMGVVSERDLFGLMGLSLRQVGAAIRRAASRSDLISAAANIRELSRGLVAQGVAASRLTRFISSLNDQLTTRVLELVELEHDIDDINWCWLALGSEGRKEQTISTDQDNALIFEPPATGNVENARLRMMAFGADVNDWLRDCGFPLCTGNIMAGQRACCQTPEEWRNAFGGWVDEAIPESILGFNKHSDFRAVAGQRDLAMALRDYVTQRARGDQIFQRLLAQDALRHTPPLNWLGQLSESERGGIDLKLHGTLPFTDAARVLAIAAGVDATATVERLRDATPVLHLDANSVRAWEDAFQFLQLLRLRHQHRLRDVPDEDIAERRRVNQIDPDTLSTVDRRILKESFRQIRKLQQRLRVEFQLGGA